MARCTRSVTDRHTAIGLSHSLNKMVRSYDSNRFQKLSKIILCSAHWDIIPYLQPDLVIRVYRGGRMECMENPKEYPNWPRLKNKAIVK